MAKKKTETDGAVATEPLPPSDVNGNGEVAEAAPEANGQKPVHSIRVLVSKDTYVQASVWEKTVQAAGGTFVTHEVSVQKRWKDQQSGEWKSLHSFRGSELYALEYVVRKAEDWILDKRTENNPL